jgi:hypothetical protein
LSTGKAGDILESDADALFAAMDLDSSGARTVDFVVFCTFMGQYHGEFQSARGELDGEKLSMAARRLSAMPLEKISITELEADDADQD